MLHSDDLDHNCFDPITISMNHLFSGCAHNWMYHFANSPVRGCGRNGVGGKGAVWVIGNSTRCYRRLYYRNIDRAEE